MWGELLRDQRTDIQLGRPATYYTTLVRYHGEWVPLVMTAREFTEARSRAIRKRERAPKPSPWDILVALLWW
jgi:hypothetical protein